MMAVLRRPSPRLRTATGRAAATLNSEPTAVIPPPRMGPATGIAFTAVDVWLAILLIMGTAPDNIGTIIEDKDEAKVPATPEAAETMPSTEERRPVIIGPAIERVTSSGIKAIFNPSGMIAPAKPARLEVRPPITDVSDCTVVAIVFVRMEIGSAPV
jgi:hypothetical protein